MSHDESRARRGGRPRGSQRRIARPCVAPGPPADLKDLLYRLYLDAGAPSVQAIAAAVARDDSLPGSPSKDSVHRIIGSSEIPAVRADVVSVAGALAQLAGWPAEEAMEQTAGAWMNAQLVQPLGAPVALLDPFDLEVHRAVGVPGGDGLPQLPVYVEREHDRRLAEIVRAALSGTSSLVTLVGESSTGKTRACWEALEPLPGEWRVWHPFDPTRPAAALDGISRVGPRTVIWLNDAQHYLLIPDADTAERITAALRSTLRDASRRPVLVLATLWPQHWHRLTARPAAQDSDPFAQQRELLATGGRRLTIPATFDGADLRATRELAHRDARLTQALAHTTTGEITQFLAGAPELLARFDTAPPGATALIKAAMDFRRLGHGIALPRALLADAAEDYIADRDDGALDEHWVEAALDYCAAPCNGVPGLLAPIRRKRHEQSAGPAYRLAGYLDQHARTARRMLCPPKSFWDAAAVHVTRPQDLEALADSAVRRGRLRHGAALYEALAGQGSSTALLELAKLRERTGDGAGGTSLYRAAADSAEPAASAALARVARQAGELSSAERHARDAADRGNTAPLVELAYLHEKTGNRALAEQLAEVAAEAGDATALIHLALLRQDENDHSAALRMGRRAVGTGDTFAYAVLARSCDMTGDLDEAERLALTASALGDTSALLELAQLREQAGQHSAAERFARAAADAGNSAALLDLAELRRQAGDTCEAERLYWDVAKRGEPYALVELAELKHLDGDLETAEQLATDAAAEGNTAALVFLAWMQEKDGRPEAAEQFARAAAASGDTSGLFGLAVLRSGRPAEAERLAHATAEAGGAYPFAFLMRLRHQNGDLAGAERLAEAAVADGDVSALVALAKLRQQSHDLEAAERLARAAADAGATTALADFARHRAEAGITEWNGFERYGLEADGSVAAPW
ncbi:transcriptional regulator [Streptomyces dioscori]|uniref:Transcriptional regulator n=1 Tax=Streptomyces dioscori TaxID=2109333 RepID=A0A2P8PVS3_9ACTN|nr:ATP-binding protein [Streptomyces dioscori]PSM38081.1 transcriptional regulator [Streptomyces dioscori]